MPCFTCSPPTTLAVSFHHQFTARPGRGSHPHGASGQFSLQPKVRLTVGAAVTGCIRIAPLIAALAAPAVNADPSRPGNSGLGPRDASRSGRVQELQAEVMTWLHEELGFPVLSSAPRIEFLPDERLAEQRFLELPAERTGAHDADVLAVYDDDTHTIYLPESWNGEQSAGGSILVHEMVHHIQNISGERFACLDAREAAAFDAQERWLGRFGDSLEDEFGIDPFTVLARSLCAW